MAASEKLIQTVSAFPVLYNASLHDYRSSERRVKAWRDVAATLGLSVLEVKRRWKTLRDRYIRERRLCQLKKEEGGRRLHYWPLRQSLAFLDAHVRRRRRHGEEQEPPEPEEAPSRTPVPLPLPPLPIVTQIKPGPTVTQLLVSGLPPGLKVAPACGSAPSAPPTTPDKDKSAALRSGEKERTLDEDELFLLSFVPALKRLTPQRRANAKMQIQQIMFDAEFKEI